MQAAVHLLVLEALLLVALVFQLVAVVVLQIQLEP
jgi:hypothetical protein